MVRITKVHTGGGDGGETSLVDGSRVPKSNARIEIVGTCDEVNALIGMILMEVNRLPDTHSDGGARITVRRVKDVCGSALGRMQSELFDLGAELACPPDQIPEYMQLIDQQDSDRLCEEMDAWIEELDPLESFILPTGSGPIAAMHKLELLQEDWRGQWLRLREEIVRCHFNMSTDCQIGYSCLQDGLQQGLVRMKPCGLQRGREAGTADMTRRQNANI